MSDIKQGDTVRIGKGVTDYTVVVAEPDRRGVLIIATPEGEYLTARLDHNLAKVEPTPADRYALISKNGETHYCRTDSRYLLIVAKERNEGGSAYAPYRVARFTFAEWVES